jgi:hypothetical protein
MRLSMQPVPDRGGEHLPQRPAGISYYAIGHDLTLKQAPLAKGVPADLYDA